MATDAYGKQWMTGDNILDNYIRKTKLTLVIEYITDETDGNVYFCVNVKNKWGDDIVDLRQLLPLSDDDILSMVKSVIRSEKIDKILYE